MSSISKATIQDLPQDTLPLILSHLPVQQIGQVARVSKAFNEAASDSQLWDALEKQAELESSNIKDSARKLEIRKKIESHKYIHAMFVMGFKEEASASLRAYLQSVADLREHTNWAPPAEIEMVVKFLSDIEGASPEDVEKDTETYTNFLQSCSAQTQQHLSSKAFDATWKLARSQHCANRLVETGASVTPSLLLKITPTLGGIHCGVNILTQPHFNLWAFEELLLLLKSARERDPELVFFNFTGSLFSDIRTGEFSAEQKIEAIKRLVSHSEFLQETLDMGAKKRPSDLFNDFSDLLGIFKDVLNSSEGHGHLASDPEGAFLDQIEGESVPLELKEEAIRRWQETET